MKSRGLRDIGLVLSTALSMVLAGCSAQTPVAPTLSPTAVPNVPTPTPNQDSWILVDLPPDATQLQHGAEVYRLVCSACHAYSGEGLTDAWRSTWAPEDQNCWQSKCHAANHPPDGFELPIAPAVVGPAALAPFATAADLHRYIQATMPWQEPNGMTEDEGWAVTAYVIRLNRMDPGAELNPENAGGISLHPESQVPTPPEASATDAPSEPQFSPPLLIGGGALALVIIFLALRATRRSREQTP